MNIRFKFMKYRKIAGIISIIIFSISVLSLTFRGLSLGLDFSGGTLVEVTYETPVELESIRTVLTNNGFEDSQVVNFGTNLDVLIKVADQNGNSSIGESVYNLLEREGYKGELKRVEFVGPQVGSELRDQGGLGMLVALFMILMYVAFRFQYKFALGAVTALGHDVVIILGLFSIFAWDFDLTVLAALLAVIGYSHFALALCSLIDEVPTTAVIIDPIRREEFSASKGSGADLNNGKIRVSKQQSD